MFLKKETFAIYCVHRKNQSQENAKKEKKRYCVNEKPQKKNVHPKIQALSIMKNK